MSLSETRIFHAKPILKNFQTKKSAFVDNKQASVQILCLANANNEILVHYKRYDQTKVRRYENSLRKKWKLIVWFNKVGKVIQDLCFNDNGNQLLVVCYDNTLHIIPILWILEPNGDPNAELNENWPFRLDEMTSFIVPFSGPHDCPNSKTCPNNNPNVKNPQNERTTERKSDRLLDNVQDSVLDKYTPAHINEMVLSNSLYQTFYLRQPSEEGQSEEATSKPSVDLLNSNAKDDEEEIQAPESDAADKSGESKCVEKCPYPLSIVWWTISKTSDLSHRHRAIIGYSDGSICVVGLSPNCPFVANTSIQGTGGVSAMVICRDTIVSSVSLLVSLSC